MAPVPGWASAVVGTVGVAVALGVGELAGALVPGAPTPLDAVGQVVIPQVPGPVTGWAIAVLGGANRLVLVLGTVLVALGLGALLGRARSRWPLTLGFVAAASLGVAAALAQPGARLGPVLAVHGLAVAAGLAAVAWLRRRADRVTATLPPTAPAAPELPSAPEAPRPAEDPRNPAVARRELLVAGGGLGVAAAGLLVLGRTTVDVRAPAPVVPELPAPRAAAPAVVAANRAPVDGVSPLHTPNDSFFRIDTALRVPRVDATTWRLRIHGLVDREVVLTYDELLAEPLVEADITLACVSNEVGGSLIGTARWLGLRLDLLLDRAGVRPEATQVIGRSVDGWTAGFPTAILADGRDALVAVGMNGEPLPAPHGFPARLVVPGLFGYVSATKWLTEIELTTWEDVDGYWIPRGWAKEGPIKTSARIDVPARGAEVAAGPTVVAGVAWAPPQGIAGVEVRIDGGPWQPAQLARALTDDTWVPWWREVDLGPGGHDLEVRATDADGQVQPEGPRPVAPDGAEGWHRVRVTAV